MDMDTSESGFIPDEEDGELSSSKFGLLAAEPDSMELMMMEMSEEEEEDFMTSASFHCHGHVSAQSEVVEFHARGFVRSGELDRMLRGQDPTPHSKTKSLELFGLVPVSPRKFFSSPEKQQLCLTLFCRFWNDMELLMTERGKQNLSHLYNESSSWKKRVEDFRDFFAFLRHAFFHAAEWTGGQSSDTIVNDNTIRFLRSISIHISSDSNCFSVSSNVNSSEVPSHAVFHLSLDARFSILSSVFYLSKSNHFECSEELNLVLGRHFFSHSSSKSEDRKEKEAFLLLVENENNSALNRVLSLLLSQLQFQMVSDLVHLAEERKQKLSDNKNNLFFNYSPFHCTCVREMWHLVIKVMDHGHCHSQFWKLIHILIEKEEKKTLFWWWLLDALLPIINLNSNGVKQAEEERCQDLNQSASLVTSKLLTLTMKEFESSSSDNNETQMRNVMRVLCRFTAELGLKLNIVSILWEFFHKRLNSRFQKSSLTLDGLEVIPKTLNEWIKSEKDKVSSNSFELFCKFLESGLNGLNSGRKNQSQQLEMEKEKVRDRINSRIMSKVSGRKLKELSEIGWYHLFSLIIQLAKVSKDQSKSLSKWLDLLKNFENSPKTTNIYLKGLGAVTLLVFKTEGQRTEVILEAFMASLERILSSSDHNQSVFSPSYVHSQQSVEVFAELLNECFCYVKSDAILGANSIIKPFIGKFLKIAKFPEAKRILKTFITLSTKLRKFFVEFEAEAENKASMTREEREFKMKVSETEAVLWKQIFTVVQNDLATKANAPHMEVADFASSLLMLHSDNYNNANIQRNLEIIKYFSTSSLVRPEVSCHFLSNLVGQTYNRFDRSSIINNIFILGWIRCCILISMEKQENDQILSNLNEDIFNLKEMRKIQQIVEELDLENHALFTLFKVLSVLQDRQQQSKTNDSPFSSLKGSNTIESLRAEFGTYLNACVECLKNVKVEILPPADLIHIYKVAGALIEHVANLVYYNVDGMMKLNLITPILNSLFCTNKVRSENISLPLKEQEAIKSALPSVLKGLSSISDFHSDKFVTKNLNDIFVIFLHRFKPQEHPFLQLFTNYFTPEKKYNLQVLFFGAVQLELKSMTRKPEPTLHFLKEAFILNRNSRYMTIAVAKILDVLMNLTLKSNNENYVVLFQLLGDMFVTTKYLRESCGLSSEKVSSDLKQFVKENLAFQAKPVFRLLSKVKCWDKWLMSEIVPGLRDEIEKLEQKRGLMGGSSNLRAQLNVLTTSSS